MKNHSYLVDESAHSSDVLNDENLFLKNKQEETSKNISQDKLGYFNSLNNFWKRLVTKPLSFSHTPNSSITSILEKENYLLEASTIKSVLSKVLELPLDSKKLSRAVENSNKIYHEDYPFDFILEFQGKRLGMMILDICYNSQNEAKPTYRFNPDLKSFQGLF